MNVNEETYKILAQRRLTIFDSKKLIDWAIMMMQNDYDSESLCILAGLDSDTTEEREKYFWKAIEELKIEVNKEDIELIDFYTIYIAKAVIDGSINPYTGLSIMQNVVRETNYSNKYVQFYELDEDIDYLKYEGHTIYNNGLSLENVETFIIKEFELFLEAEKLQINELTREMCYCEKCKEISKPTLKRKFRFRSPHRISVWVCSNCGADKIEQFSSQKGKEVIMNILGQQPNDLKMK